MQKKYKNIIFDLGGVILDIDYQRTIQAFNQFEPIGMEKLYSQQQQAELFDKFEKGLISEAEFRNSIRKFFSVPLTDQQIDDAWNAMLLSLPPERIHLLERLKTQYRTFLLSNTNAIHMCAYTKQLHDKYGYKSLADLFEKQYFSHELHMRKPDIEIFQKVLLANNLTPSETLFLDDSPINLQGAAKLGIDTMLVTKEQGIVQIFNN